MGRIRSVKPEFFKHEEMFQAEVDTGLPLRVAFIALWTVADREGRFKWRPRALKLECLPYDDCDFSRVLDALASRGFVVAYEAGGEKFGHIPSFAKHQMINNREIASSLPDPSEIKELTRQARVDDASSTPLNLAQGEGKGREGEREGDISLSNERLVGETSSPPPDEPSFPLGEVIPIAKPKADKREALLKFGEDWNALAAELRLPMIDEIKSGSTRERHALARLRELDGDYGQLLARIRGSPYLRGEVNGFRCTFDWIVNASNFQKIMEGNYEDRKRAAKRA